MAGRRGRTQHGDAGADEPHPAAAARAPGRADHRGPPGSGRLRRWAAGQHGCAPCTGTWPPWPRRGGASTPSRPPTPPPYGCCAPSTTGSPPCSPQPSAPSWRGPPRARARMSPTRWPRTWAGRPAQVPFHAGVRRRPWPARRVPGGDRGPLPGGGSPTAASRALVHPVGLLLRPAGGTCGRWTPATGRSRRSTSTGCGALSGEPSRAPPRRVPRRLHAAGHGPDGPARARPRSSRRRHHREPARRPDRAGPPGPRPVVPDPDDPAGRRWSPSPTPRPSSPGCSSWAAGPAGRPRADREAQVRDRLLRGAGIR